MELVEKKGDSDRVLGMGTERNETRVEGTTLSMGNASMEM